MMTLLNPDAVLVHEDARHWYGAYGWHLTTEREGDVTLDAVDYDWLDRGDDEAAAKLRECYHRLTEGEAENIITMARSVRDAAEAVEALLVKAVEAYRRGDVDAVVEALDEAERLESSHGDNPASRSLSNALLRHEDDDDEVDGIVGYAAEVSDGAGEIE